MRKTCKLTLLLIMISMLISPVVTIDNQPFKDPVTYRIIVDQDYGFFRIYKMTDNKISSDYIIPENNTLIISEGDIVTFASDSKSDQRLTIISEEQLWSDEDGSLAYAGKEFSYKFDNSGIFNVYIKENPSLEQKIVIETNELESIVTNGSIDTNDTIDTNELESIVTNDTIDTNELKSIVTNDTIDTNELKSIVTNDTIDTNEFESIVTNDTIDTNGSTLYMRIVLLLVVGSLSLLSMMNMRKK